MVPDAMRLSSMNITVPGLILSVQKIHETEEVVIGKYGYVRGISCFFKILYGLKISHICNDGKIKDVAFC